MRLHIIPGTDGHSDRLTLRNEDGTPMSGVINVEYAGFVDPAQGGARARVLVELEAGPQPAPAGTPLMPHEH